MLIQRFSKPVTPGVKVVLPNHVRPTPAPATKEPEQKDDKK